MSGLRGDVEASLLEVRETDGGGEAEFSFSSELEVFAGHFPGRPILPGVLQVEMARTTMERLLKRKFRITRLIKAKFMREVKPGERILLVVKAVQGEDGLKVKAAVSVGGEKAAQLSLCLRARK